MKAVARVAGVLAYPEAGLMLLSNIRMAVVT